MTRENKMVELLQQENTSEVGKEDENLILLLLSSDLRDRYMKTLVDRLIKIGVVVAIEEIDYPKEKKEKYEWILNFSGNIPKGKSADLKNSKLIFRVLGKAELKQDKLDSGDLYFMDKNIHINHKHSIPKRKNVNNGQFY